MDRKERKIVIACILSAWAIHASCAAPGHPAQAGDDPIPATVIDYVAANYPQADSIRYLKDPYTDASWGYKNRYTVSFSEKGEAMSLKIDEEGRLICLTKAFPTEKIPAFASKYIEMHYENATIQRAERKYLYVTASNVYDEQSQRSTVQQKVVRSPSDTFYRIYFSYQDTNCWTGKPDRFETWVEFNRKREFVGRIIEI